ncbi:hypothetical protein [Methanofollis fontis]|uniref:Uncharacterized protein n=1 Tax=Methanofollis fontis TaxID=2052832 RepID=A0A483CR10_9EURY|nr:hypothetical protein [Methanofollis fontis]TAJ44611.1 hypothetical protein CUJ86_04715 [Methanofollis fontis]
MRTCAAILCVVALASLAVPALASPALGGPDLLSLPAGGSTADLTITLDGAEAGLSGYNLSLALNPTGIAEIVAVGYPTWANMPMNGSIPAPNTWIQAVDLEMGAEPGKDPTVLATITIRGIADGRVTMTVTPVVVDDDQGGRYTLDPLWVAVQVGAGTAETFETGDGPTEDEAPSSVEGPRMTATPHSPAAPDISETTEIITTSPSPSPAVPADEQTTTPPEAAPGFDRGTSCLAGLVLCALLLLKLKRGE